jgi:hypothetical protein
VGICEDAYAVDSSDPGPCLGKSSNIFEISVTSMRTNIRIYRLYPLWLKSERNGEFRDPGGMNNPGGYIFKRHRFIQEQGICVEYFAEISRSLLRRILSREMQDNTNKHERSIIT